MRVLTYTIVLAGRTSLNASLCASQVGITDVGDVDDDTDHILDLRDRLAPGAADRAEDRIRERMLRAMSATVSPSAASARLEGNSG